MLCFLSWFSALLLFVFFGGRFSSACLLPIKHQAAGGGTLHDYTQALFGQFTPLHAPFAAGVGIGQFVGCVRIERVQPEVRRHERGILAPEGKG